MQPEAVQAVADAAQCLTSGLNDPRRPAASFLFGGPPGSGKVLLAKQAAEALLGSAEKLIQIHAADYAQSHSLSRLIGTPVCTGFDKGGQLTECVRRRPISVVLIQEIEKACIEFRQFIQTILDEGSVKDGEGRLVDFTNCMVIITTNIGQESILQAGYTPDQDAGADAERKQYVTRIQQAFPAEFLARVDDLLVFRRITQDSMSAIVDKRLQEVALQLQRIKLDLDVREEAKIHLANVGWSRRTGASKLEGVIRAQVLLPLSAAILQNDVLDKSTVRLSYDEIQDRIVVEPISPTVGPTEPTDDSASVISSLPSPETGSDNFSHPSTHATARVTESRTPQHGFFYGSSASFPAHTASTASRIATLATQLKPRRLF
ncbi:hypothetical protein EIP86_009602 [Pleurotus ostreatoroseus]|nr:hypothetical protein EIP86_009602 [Pleurotus ostreatoroseus]